MPVAWILALVDLAIAGFAGSLARALDFFGTGLNAAQVMAGSVVVTLVLSACALALPRSTWLLRTALGLETVDLLAVLGLSAWYALASSDAGTPNPMHFYWMHATAAGLVFAINIGTLLSVAPQGVR